LGYQDPAVFHDERVPVGLCLKIEITPFDGRRGCVPSSRRMTEVAVFSCCTSLGCVDAEASTLMSQRVQVRVSGRQRSAADGALNGESLRAVDIDREAIA
jgi:hypothetical protein